MAAKALGLGGLLLAALLIGMTPATGATRSLRAPACRVWQLAISSGPEISEKTGQHSLTIRLTNRGRAVCLLDGYPTVGLRDARGRLPLQISHRGDTMIAGHRPRPVTVRAGGSAYVVINKYRCDLGDRRVARTLVLRLPRAAPSMRLLLSVPHGYILGYCGRSGPGSRLAVSPFEPTVYAALR
jgi:hypothetical protein